MKHFFYALLGLVSLTAASVGFAQPVTQIDNSLSSLVTTNMRSFLQEEIDQKKFMIEEIEGSSPRDQKQHAISNNDYIEITSPELKALELKLQELYQGKKSLEKKLAKLTKGEQKEINRVINKNLAPLEKDLHTLYQEKINPRKRKLNNIMKEEITPLTAALTETMAYIKKLHDAMQAKPETQAQLNQIDVLEKDIQKLIQQKQGIHKTFASLHKNKPETVLVQNTNKSITKQKLGVEEQAELDKLKRELGYLQEELCILQSLNAH